MSEQPESVLPFTPGIGWDPVVTLKGHAMGCMGMGGNPPKIFPQGLLNLKFVFAFWLCFWVLRVSGSTQVGSKTSLLPLEPLEPLREVRSLKGGKLHGHQAESLIF